jgi:hypothetical protein
MWEAKKVEKIVVEVVVVVDRSASVEIKLILKIV